jgi:hypothetical protein
MGIALDQCRATPRPLAWRLHCKEVAPVSTGEIAYLALVLAAFGGFAISLAIVSRGPQNPKA